MSYKALTEDEKRSLNQIIEDLQFIFGFEEILPEEIDGILERLKSDEVKTYIKNLEKGSKPETALREAFFAGKSVLSKYLSAEISPEINLGPGFIDYLISIGDRFILLELKSLFEAETEELKGGRVLKKLKQKTLNWKDHKEQILKYIQKGGEYIILTNLKEWLFFNDNCSPDKCDFFYSTDIISFRNDFDVIGNLFDFLERQDLQSIREELDKRFFESLKAWVKKLSEVEFDVDEKRKVELIIGLINKFIFIQTLDDYGVVDFRWVKNTWDHFEQRWHTKGKLQVLHGFFREVMEWFYEHYDTELFRGDVLEHIKKDTNNIELFYKNLQLVLGTTYWQTALAGFRGIMQYKFKYIDEDILGKAYETFLAEIKKEKGIYYTPRYITEYIVENTVGKKFDDLLIQIKDKINAENFDEIKKLTLEFTSIRILDPACGSGSFLIKTIRKIFNKYQELISLIQEIERKYNRYAGTLSRPEEIEEKVEKILEIQKLLKSQNNRELISRILLRHIHGNDLDRKALEVAKVNIWLEAIKLSPSDFRYDRLPAETNHILPDLEINLGNGDSLVGLPSGLTIEYLGKKHKEDIKKISELRHQYLENPSKTELIEKIEKIKDDLRRELDEKFKGYIEENDLPEEILKNVKLFHWPLEYWYVFFDDYETLPEEKRGFDVVIGNPPYVDYRRVDPISLHEFFKTTYESSKVAEKYNLYILFIERSLSLMNKNGKFGYINPVQWMGSLMGLKLRELIYDNYAIKEIDDLSKIGVFEEPTLTNLGLFFFDGHGQEKIKIGYKVTKDEVVDKRISFSLIDKEEFFMDPDKIIILDPSQDTRDIIEKVERFGLKLEEIAGLEWGTSQSGYGKKKISSEEYDSLSPQEKKKYAPLVQTGDIIRHLIVWKGEYIDVDIYSDRRLEQFNNPKLVFSRRAPRIECVYDDSGFYLGKVAFTPELKGKHLILLGIVNSSLLDFYFKKVYETLHPGGNLRLDIPYLHQLPIKMPQDKEEKLSFSLENFIKEIIILKKSHQKLAEIWNEWSDRLKSDEYTLHQILTNDANLMRKGEFDKAWTSKVTFFPNGKHEELEQEFKELIIVGDNKDSVFRIYGLNENNMEELIYEMEFGNRDLMLHVYFTLLKAIESKVLLKTLSQLLNKTIVPIVKEVNKSPSTLTPNIITATRNEFEKWLKENKIQQTDPDIIRIDNKIEDIDAGIDSLVFKLYKLTEKEVNMIMKSLLMRRSYQQKILEHFES